MTTAGAFVANPGAGGAIFAADRVDGENVPYSKMAKGPAGVLQPITDADPMPVAGPLTDSQLRASAVQVAIAAKAIGYNPGYGPATDLVDNALPIDPSGHVAVRGSVLTDEGTFRVNFANTSLAVAIGTVTVSGDTVTGAGFAETRDVHLNDYFKLDADGESAWRQIASIDSDTQLTLVAPYVGGTSGAASRALIRPVTGSGGSIAVASGQATLATGTTASAITRLVRNVDVAPLVYRARLSVSQRIANQTFFVGLSESFTTADRWFARFRIDGTTNTTVICESGRNPTTTPSPAETESTTITLPNALTTAALAEYRVELLTESCRFFVGGILVASHTRSIPAQHDEMECSVTCINGAVAPTSSTSVVVDYITGKNHNKLEVGVMSDAEQIIATSAPLQVANYNVAGVIAINTDILILSCNQLRSISLQATSIGTTGRLDFFLTNDLSVVGTAQPAYPIGGGAGVTTTTAAGMWVIPTNGAAFLRVRMGVATTGGTTTVFATGSQSPAPNPLPATQPVSGSITATGTVGTAAFGAAASGNPVQIGTQAQTAQPTARTAGQMVAPLFSSVGHAITMVGQIRQLNDTNVPVTIATTTETTIVPAVAATFNDIYSLTIANTSATGVRVDFRTVTAGAVVESVWVPPTSTIQLNPAVPYKQATVNTAWTAQLSAAVTDVRISARTVRNI